jgi:preprotein translocase subunit SecG
MYIFCIIMICIASILLILAVLVQSPKSGMAANFGAANQTMGVRQTTDFLEKFTWAMVAAVVFFSLLSTTANPRVEVKSAGETDYAGEVEKMNADDQTTAVSEQPEFVPVDDLKQITPLNATDDVETATDVTAVETTANEAAAVEATAAEVSAAVEVATDEAAVAVEAEAEVVE